MKTWFFSRAASIRALWLPGLLLLLIGCATVRRGCGCASVDPFKAYPMRVDSVVVLPHSPGNGFPLYLNLPLAPHTIARSGANGTAVVHVSVGADGGVLTVDIVGNTHRELDEAIAEAAQYWRFVEIPEPFGGAKRGLEMECRLAFGEFPQ